MKTWLCTENGDEFIVEAETYSKAKKMAELYGGILLGLILEDNSVILVG